MAAGRREVLGGVEERHGGGHGGLCGGDVDGGVVNRNDRNSHLIDKVNQTCTEVWLKGVHIVL